MKGHDHEQDANEHRAEPVRPAGRQPTPPRRVDRLLEWLLPPDLLEDVLGDLHEVFGRQAAELGAAKARRAYLWAALTYAQPYFYRRRKKFDRPVHPYPNHFLFSAMLRSYFLTAYRNLRRQPAFTAINVVSLALGITCCLLIFLLLRQELSYDRFHAKADRMYRVSATGHWNGETSYTGITPYPLARALRTDFPELETVTQINHGGAGLVTVGTKRFPDPELIFADSLFLSVFKYPLLAGDPRTALAQPNSVVLSESLARTYFGDAPALGKEMLLDNADLLKVTGVMKDVPRNTHLPFQMVVSFANYQRGNPDVQKWDYSNHGYVYVVLPQKLAPGRIESKLPAFMARHIGAETAKNARFLLQPVTDIRFDTRFALHNVGETVGRETHWALASLGVLLVLIGCVNFINLSAARALRRQREVGVRKVLGGRRSQLVWQFLAETLLLTTLAAALSVGITFLLVPRLNAFLGFTELAAAPDGFLVAFVAGLTAVVALLSGLYPALTLSAYQPVLALKNGIGAITGRKSLFSLGRGMVVFQFAAAQVLIIGTLVVTSQTDYFRRKELGFAKDALVNFRLPTRDVQKLSLLRNELLRHPRIAAVSFGKGAPTSNDHGFGTNLSVEGKEGISVFVKAVDAHYQDTYGLTLRAGRWLADREVKDGRYEFIINETLLRKMGYRKPEEALGRTVKIWLWQPFEGTVTGVVRDFHLTSLKEEIAPLALLNLPVGFSQAGVKLAGGHTPETLAYVKNVFSRAFPQEVFTYEFLDEHIARLYAREDKIEKLFTAFAGMAVFIACLGLLGLSAHAAVQRTKEVGIRKVLGASLPQLVALLSREFALLVGVAFLVAAPLGWYLMHKWLENFAYRVTVRPGTLLLAGLGALAVALLTVSFQAVKAARANPVHSLRSE
ncbi:MAG: Acidobacterial duplicated orphan permease (function unknown) [uncultured Cytophagales bacterium]|uniref:ABC transporter, fused permease protein n=1 Tax=uncultured Cytophagales bacterium TaxID=158755 RepID=A0A6J4HUE1_9SPHI|nr:MAG: Acidobacterial duplicated orphan permease (function unknown) [uncultured Cytophagales bacterium]